MDNLIISLFLRTDTDDWLNQQTDQTASSNFTVHENPKWKVNCKVEASKPHSHNYISYFFNV
ncbi:hypothetical protein DASC09_012850 [Saccharomycopsis crataegensis]|uniref:Uncharacterized protein n=1 Tax=Saccharomycopsis crataegensis TaxID=43959 RepID=A0AAV5QHL8_9ASCO|nr:hypothetical protein DASC09_012850 [Saccharomycopsis crataegensis]